MLLAAPGVAQTGATGLLAPGEDAGLVFGFCTRCHSERIIVQQGLSRESWDETIDWMVEEQGMAEIPAPLRVRILDYLSEHYNPERPLKTP